MKDKKLWKELIRLLSVECQPTTAVLAQTCMGVIFHLFSVWYNFCNAFSYETACGPPGKPPWTTGGQRTTVWETL